MTHLKYGQIGKHRAQPTRPAPVAGGCVAPTFLRPSFSLDHTTMSRAARVTLAASFVLAAGTIFGVHYLQNAEREVHPLIAFRHAIF